MRVLFQAASTNMHDMIECWEDCPDRIPQEGEYVSLINVYTEREISEIEDNARCWGSPHEGLVQEVTLLKDGKGFYYRITLICEEKEKEEKKQYSFSDLIKLAQAEKLSDAAGRFGFPSKVA